MKPLNNYIAIKKVEIPAEKKESGVYIATPHKVDDEYHIGEIAFVSDNAEKAGVKKGDKILYKHYRNIEYNDCEFILTEDVIAKL